MRRIEVYLAGLFVALASLAAYLGAQSGWSDELVDPRLSTHLTGPRGARALADAFDALGVTVERRERAYFTIADSANTELLAFLDPPGHLTPRERLRVSTLAARGGHLALVGDTGLESCFGLRVARGDDLSLTARGDTSLDLPAVDRYYVADDGENNPEADEACAAATVTAEDTLLAGPDDEAVAVALTLDGGGSVRLVADGTLLTNEALRNTDAGVVLIPWLLASGQEGVVVDEYHHGFDAGASLWGAAWRWLRTSPLGWTILQLGAVALLALFTLGARFGPPRPHARVERRSELEHIDALGVGLRNAGGHQAAIDLLINGLRRRLGRSEHGATVIDPGEAWTKAFDHLDAPNARRALDTLRTINTEPVATRVRTAAEAVEDLWIAMTSKP